MSETEDKRKLEAILAADVAGYSRLMQQDDEATVATLEICRAVFREKIQAHRGRVVDMTGDSVLAVFEAATEAVRSAFDIQSELAQQNEVFPKARQMHFRIGVNVGEVIEKADGTVYGDGVNIAARLQNIADPGGVMVSGTAYDQVKNRVRGTFDSIGEQKVKNIAHPIRAYRASSGTREVSEPSEECAAVSASPSLPDRPSIAVLPFLNLSDDPKQEYFSDGMTEDVITSLSKLSGLFVIARNSVFTYKGRAVKPEQVGRELGVRYVLEGSVRKAQRRVRITAQLIDTSTGYHLWAERYDAELKDVFVLQDGITQQIVAALGPRLTAAEGSRIGHKETSSVEAYDDFLRGFALWYEFRKNSAEMAREKFERAIALDPGYARAHVWLAWTYFVDWEFQWTEGSSSLIRAVETAKKAVAMDDSLSDAHTILGWSSLWNKNHDLAIAELERAASLDPNSEWAYGFLGEVLNLSGRADEAIGFIKKAMRLDPHYPPWLVHHLAHSYFLLRRYDEAIAALQDALHRNPDFLPARRLLAAVYAELGREKEAQNEVAEILRISPGASLQNWSERTPYKNQCDLDRFITGLRNAGMS